MKPQNTGRRVLVFALTIAVLLASPPGARGNGPAAPAATPAASGHAGALGPVHAYLNVLRALNRPRSGLGRVSDYLARRSGRENAMTGLADALVRITVRRDGNGGPAVTSEELGAMVGALRGEQHTSKAFDRKTFEQLVAHLTKVQDYLRSGEQGPAAGGSPEALARSLVADQPSASWPHDSVSGAPNATVHGLERASAYAGPSVLGRSLNMTHMGTVIEQHGARAAGRSTLEAMVNGRNAYYQHLVALHRQQLRDAKARGMSSSAIADLRAEQVAVRQGYLKSMGSRGFEYIRDVDGWGRFTIASSGEIGAEKAHLRGLRKAEKGHERWVRRADTAAANQAQFETKKTHWLTIGGGALALGAVMLSLTGVGLATLPLLLQGSTALAAWTNVGLVAGGVVAGGGAGQYVANRVQGLRAGLNGAWVRAADDRLNKAAAVHKATLAYYGLNANAPSANDDRFRRPSMQEQPAAGTTAPAAIRQDGTQLPAQPRPKVTVEDDQGGKADHAAPGTHSDSPRDHNSIDIDLPEAA